MCPASELCDLEQIRYTFQAAVHTSEGQATGGFLNTGVWGSGRLCWKQEFEGGQDSSLTCSVSDHQRYVGQCACLFDRLN